MYRKIPITISVLDLMYKLVSRVKCDKCMVKNTMNRVKCFVNVSLYVLTRPHMAVTALMDMYAWICVHVSAIAGNAVSVKVCILIVIVYVCAYVCVHHTFSLKMVTFSEEKHWGVSTE